MAITVEATKINLSWSDFTVSETQLWDSGDNSWVDAYTTFQFNLPDLPPRTVDGMMALADPMKIKISPKCSVWSQIRQTSELLSHEEWHYHVGIAIARAFARHATSLRARDVGGLRNVFQEAFRLHFVTRARLLQSRYDIDTGHGTNAHYQKIWKDRMTRCLANPNSNEIGGYYL
jgi:hypothetical protein